MIDGLINGLDEFIATTEDFFTDGSEVLEGTENVESRNFISETDEIRANETAEIMKDIFTEEIIASWPEMTLDERAAKLNEYYIRAGENLGIETKGVIIEDMPSSNPFRITFGYNSGDGYIHLNESIVMKDSQLKAILDTATHEMRHQFQCDALANPENFSDIPKDVFDKWQYEWTPGNYIDPSYDPEGYEAQAIECDSRNFAEGVLDFFEDKMNLN